MEVQEILKNIMKQEDCSATYALYLLLRVQDKLREDKSCFNSTTLTQNNY